MAEPVALMALAFDAAFGWPRALYNRIGHPVGLFARVIGGLELRWNRHERSERVRYFLGIATVVILVGGAGAAGGLLEAAFLHLFGPFAWFAIALAAWPALAQRSLFDHVQPIATHLRNGDPERARDAVAMIVGRDTGSLDEAAMARATIESLSESFCDGVTAPLLWLLAGGLPGIWIYKAVNTADSLIGHKEEQWRAFGWAAARTDDVLNLIPARIGGMLICLAGGRGWRIMVRDAGKHTSPNAGWTEAAMAGVLRLRLAGPVSYDGVMQAKDWIGEGNRQATVRDISTALRIYLRACLLLWLIAGGVAWAL